MTSITIDCDTQIGQTIDVETGDVVTMTGSHFELPEWLESGTGTVPGYGVWSIETMDGYINLQNLRPTHCLTFEDHVISVYQDDCPKIVKFGGTWLIEGVQHEKEYTVTKDVFVEMI